MTAGTVGSITTKQQRLRSSVVPVRESLTGLTHLPAQSSSAAATSASVGVRPRQSIAPLVPGKKQTRTVRPRIVKPVGPVNVLIRPTVDPVQPKGD